VPKVSNCTMPSITASGRTAARRASVQPRQMPSSLRAARHQLVCVMCCTTGPSSVASRQRRMAVLCLQRLLGGGILSKWTSALAVATGSYAVRGGGGLPLMSE